MADGIVEMERVRLDHGSGAKLLPNSFNITSAYPSKA